MHVYIHAYSNEGNTSARCSCDSEAFAFTDIGPRYRY